MKCLICSKECKNLEAHIRRLHKIDREEYSKQFNYDGPFMISMSDEAKAKMIKKKRGKTPWNKGLTKETDNRIKSTAGRKMTEEQKALISQKTKEAMKRPEVKEKLGKVALNFHMHDRPEVREKMRKTMIEKYGNKTNYWGANSKKYEQFKDVLSSKTDLQDTIKECKNILKYKPSALDLAEFIGCTPTVIYSKVREYSLESEISFKESRLESMFKEWLDTLNIEYVEHDRKHIYPKEIDFYFPKYNLAIEINDIYSHNSTYPSYRGKTPTNPNYHQDKTLLANSKGIRLIHIYEWEILNQERFNRIKSYLLDIFSPTLKIYARECDIKYIDKTEARQFFRENHLQGVVNNMNDNIALIYNNEIVSCMSFGKPRFGDKYEYELLRFANKSRYSIVGAASRLFKNFLKDKLPESIISYCDLDKFSGNIYETLNFKELRTNAPTYNWTNYKEVINWKTVLDRGVDNLFNTNYGKGADNEKLMIEELGFVKVYNAGTKVYIYENV